MIDNKKLLLVLSKIKTPQPPVWFMRQAGRYLPEYRELREKAGSFWNLCLNPEMAAEVTLQPMRRFNFDAAIIFSDILIVPQALGQKVDFLPNHGPVLEKINLEKIVNSWKEQTYLAKLEPTLQALQIVKQNLSSYQALIGFSGAPWTLATYMLNIRIARGFEEKLDILNEEPEMVKSLLTLLADVVANYLLAQLKNGAEVVKIFDSWAGIVPLNLRKQLILNPLKLIVSQIRKIAPHAPIIYFGRKISSFYPQIIEEIPNLTLAFDQFTDPIDIASKFQPLVPVQGNLDPELLLTGGYNLIDATNKLLENLSKGPYVFNLGHGILPQTPPHHVQQVIDIIRKF